MVTNIINWFFVKNERLFTLCFLLIIALKWSFLFIAPVWDEAFSIFPAAGFLVNHSFDYSLLLAQPPYHDGGPTAHGLSLLTLVTALVLKITGGGAWAWGILHVSQWIMAAAIGTLLTRMYSNLIGVIPAFLLAFATLVYPLMLTQLGSMYLEVPLLFFSLLAFHYSRVDRTWLASLFLITACMIKGSGIIAAGVLAFLSFYDHKKTIGKRILDAFVMALPALIVVLVPIIIVDHKLSLAPSYESRGIFKIIMDRNISVYRAYIAYIPELIVIFGSSLLIAILFLFRGIHGYTQKRQVASDIVAYNCLFLILYTLFHFVVYAYIQTSDSHFLSRYFCYSIPSMVFMIYYLFDKIINKTNIKVFILLVIIGVFLFNRDGLLYPPIPISCIATAERSEEYIDGYHVQKEYIHMLEKQMPEEVPIFVNLPDYFLTHYAVLGYVSKPLPNVHFIGHALKAGGMKYTFPDHFLLVYHYPWLGGQLIMRIIREVSNHKEYSVRFLASFKKGYFEAYIYEIKRLSS
jgi:hypothetical protein